MRDAETVTFGGSGLDRAAEIRSDPDALAASAADPRSRAIALWRGKPLVGEGGLTRLPLDHPLCAGAGPDPAILLGRDESGAALFAMDLSGWEPDAENAPSPGFLDPTEQVHPEAPDGATFRELRATMTHLDARDAELAATARGVMEWHRTHRFCATCGAASDMIEAGWQRQCPSCDRRHFPRTDPVVIMLILSGNDVLIGRSPGWPDGMYSLLAGFVEPGETIEAAVRREVFEEAGIRVGDVGYLASQPWPFPASLMMGCIGQATSRKITVDPVELEHALWVSRERMMSIMAGADDEVRPARKGAIAHFLVSRWLADTLD